MNKEQLEQRIAQIKLSQDTLKGQFSTLQGHLDEALFWLGQLDAPAVETVTDAAPVEEPVQEVEPVELDLNENPVE